MATEVHKLESRLWRRIQTSKLKTIMISSALQGEGKSTTVAYLAAATAMHRERRVLAVDLDFRWPQLHTHFDTDPRDDFINYLKGDGVLDDVIVSTEIPNLDLILASPCEESPDTLLNSKRLRHALETLPGRYDLILLDVPALVPVADAAAVMPYADGLLLVVMAGRSSKSHLARARELCLGMEMNILGLVVGNIQEAAPGYLDSAYYGAAGPSRTLSIDQSFQQSP
jgi:capsular exopolysaccharide synthesis family protein